MRWTAVISITLLGLGCSSKSTGANGDCEANADCGAGAVCLNGTCEEVCTSDTHCVGALICDDGVCRDGNRESPVITGVTSNGATDTTTGHASSHLATEVILSGSNLTGSQVTLSDGDTNHVLDKCSESPTELVLAMPDLPEGNYLITVVNQAGSCSSTLPILQGETGLQGIQGPIGPDGVPCSDGCVDAASIGAGVVGATHVDTSEVQARVTGTCTGNQAMGSVDAAGAVGCVGPFLTDWTEMLSEDFQGGPPSGSNWTFTTLTICDNKTILGGYAELGTNSVTLTVASLPTHTEVRLIADVFFIDSWDVDQNPGNDVFRVDHGGVAIYTENPSTAFSTTHMCGNGTYTDWVRRVDVTLFDSAATVAFDFIGNTTEATTNESWGLDNVRVLVR